MASSEGATVGIRRVIALMSRGDACGRADTVLWGDLTASLTESSLITSW